MKINLSPVDGLPSVSLAKQGDTLTINGESFDFIPLGDGDELPPEAISSNWFAAPVQRIDGELIISIFLPLPPNCSQAQAFPEPLVDVPDGQIDLPQAPPEGDLSEESYA